MRARADHQGVLLLGLQVCFLYPVYDLPAIGRVKPDPVASPGLSQAILLPGEEQRAEGIMGSGSWIQGEVVKLVKFRENPVWSLPLPSPAAPHRVVKTHGGPPGSSAAA